MIKNITYTLCFFCIGFLFSCNSNETDLEVEEKETMDEKLSDTTDFNEVEIQDTLGHVEAFSEDEDLRESQKKIKEEFGTQWDFCTCIVKNDSVDKAIGGEDVTDADLDFLLERLEFIDENCKGMLIQPNSTPEERNAHDKKVRKCLKG